MIRLPQLITLPRKIQDAGSRLAPVLAVLLAAAPAAWADSAAKKEAPVPKPAETVAPAENGRPDYVRIAEDGKSVRLETAVTSFSLPDGRTVDLFGVVHLADGSYYREVDRQLGTYDAVLFELVGDPEALTERKAGKKLESGSNPLRAIQEGMGRVFRLEFQLEHIDYTRPSFVHADASAGEFARMQKERGESMAKLMMKSFQLAGDPSMREAETLGLADLLLLFHSEKAMLRVKGIFARLLANNERVMESRLLGSDSAIIHGRNGVALKKLSEVLADPARKRVAVFYGAGHMPSMEEVLIRDFKARRGTEVWLAAWTMPAGKTDGAGIKAEPETGAGPRKEEPAAAPGREHTPVPEANGDQ